METLKLLPPKNVTWDYDDEADVLDLFFGEPQPALTLDLGKGVLVRYLEKGNVLVGLTLIGVRALAHSTTGDRA
ncbi:MAG: DUF2283 domain-containing protein [Dehalococcoidia bacterium]|nr:DUF2283 domain-containing protein [Dehalococcoidia bacterium]